MTELIQRLKRSELIERFGPSAFLVFMLTLLMCFLALSSASAQGGLACDDLVNVSLYGDNCEHVITAGIIVESSGIVDSDFDVTVSTQEGTALSTSPTITSEHVGELLKVEVKHKTDSRSCWGNIRVELQPVFANCSGGVIVAADGNPDNITLELSCGQLDTTLSKLSVPPLEGNCSTVKLDTSFTDEFTSPCHSGVYIDLITRTWTVSDPNGKTGTCDQIIGVLRPSLANVVWPPHFDSDTLIREDDALYDEHREQLSCDFFVDTSGMVVNVGSTVFNDDGSPSPETTGYPSDISCKNVQYTYKDTFIPICGNGFKILREWSLLDWCTGNVLKHHQIIKLVDDRGPVVTCPIDTIIVSTNPWNCLGTIDALPDPTVIFDCSATTYEISYKLRDVDGDPFDNPITDNVIDNGDGTYGISDLPVDTTWIVYTITDECGFSTQCFTEISVEDGDPPNAICEQNTVVSLDVMGNGRVPADRFDDHSYDNCGVVRFEARKKDDLIYKDTLVFTCADMGPEGVQVAMRAYDAHGGFGECWVTAKVQNKVVNVLESCPADITINCDDSTHPDDTGRPVLDESCITATMEFSDENALQCGEGKILRTWTITDLQEDSHTCIQIINVTDTDPFTEFDIKWPENVELDGCTLSGTDPNETGRPEFVNLDCVDLSVGYEDEIFDLVDGCKKIVREWVIVDWCRYDANFGLDRTRFSYYQSIKISNTSSPTFIAGCDTLSFDANENCLATVTLTAQAEDDCTGSDNLTYRWELDENHNGNFISNKSGIGASESGDFGIGTHAIKWYVTDECGNTTSCFQIFSVIDNSIPSFTCLGALSLSLGNEGWVEVWASDFVKDVTASCGNLGDSDLSFSFDQDTLATNFKVDCAHFYDYEVGGGLNYLKELKVYVMKGDNAVDFCTVTLRVTDNFDRCPDFETQSASISGRITTENNQGLEEFEVMLKNMMDDSESMSMTSTTGEYAFSGVGLYDDYVVDPQVNDIAVNGVSTLDIVLMQQHILGIRLLDSPYKQIAADINRSGSISASDLVAARKLILGLINEFPNSNSWRFVDASHTFESVNGVLNYPEQIDFHNVIENKEDANFIGIKVGDVNESVRLSFDQTEVRSNASVRLQVEDMEFDAGKEYLIPVILKDDKTQNIKGIQLDLEFNNRVVEILGVSAGDLDLTKHNYVVEEGSIKFSWNSIETVELSDNGALFYINIKTKSKNQFSNVFNVREDAIASEFIGGDLEVKPIDLTFSKDGIVSDDFALFQNKPNPFSDQTTVSFNLPKAGVVAIKIFDTKGQLVMQSEKEFEKGFNELDLNFQGVNHSGVLYLNLVAGKHSANTKMVLIK